MPKRRWILRLGVIGLALGATLWGGFAYLTRPAALLRWINDALSPMRLRVVDAAHIGYSVRSGLVAEGLSIASADAESDRSHADRRDPPLVHVERLDVRIDALALVGGGRMIREVRMRRPVVSYVVAKPEEALDASLDVPIPGGGLTGETAQRLTEWALNAAAALPSLTLDEGDINLLLRDGSELRLLSRWRIRGTGRREAGRRSDVPGADVAEARSGRAYALRLEQVAGPVVRTRKPQTGPPAVLELRITDDAVTARSGWIDCDVARRLLPPALAERIAPYTRGAAARVSDLVLDADGVRELALALDNVEFAVPIEADDALADAARFLQLHGGHGVVRLRRANSSTEVQVDDPPGKVQFELDGRLNDGGLTLRGEVELRGDTGSGRLAANPPTSSSPEGLLRAIGDLDVTMRIEDMTLPDVDRHPGFVRSPRLPEGARDFFRNYDPRGPVDFSLSLKRSRAKDAATAGGTEAHPPLHYEGVVVARGGSTRPKRFPYTWYDLAGRVVFSNEGIVIDALTGRNGSGRLRVNGRASHAESWTAFSIDADGWGIALDDDFLAALPEEYHGLWADADPVGLCDVAVALRREEGSQETGAAPTDIRVEARLAATDLTVAPGQRLERADGLVRIERGVLTVADLHGFHDGGRVHLHGALRLTSAPESREQWMSITGTDVSLKTENEIRDAHGALVGLIRFDGRGDLWGQARQRGHVIERNYTIRVDEGRLHAFDAAQSWSGARGWVAITPQRREIIELYAENGRDSIRVRGLLPSENPEAAELATDLRVSATTRAVDMLLRQIVPQRWTGVRDALGVGGAGTLEMRLRATADGTRQDADATLRIEHMRPTPLPLDLREVDAQLGLHTGGFSLTSAAARYGAAGTIEIRGGGSWDADPAWSELHADVTQIPIDDAFIQAMPAALARILRRMEASGTASGTFDRIRVTGGAAPEWDFVGRLRLQQAALRLGLPLTEAEGELSGRCTVGPDGETRVALDFTVARGLLSGRPIERFEGHVLGDGGDGWLTIRDLRGRVADGEVFGEARFDPESGAHELSLTLSGLELAGLLPQTLGEERRPRTGRVDGRIFLRGASDDPTAREGGGELRIRAASLLSSPVTASVFAASAARQRPIGESVDQAVLRFVWRGSELTFSRVEIESRDLRLVGEGSWNMNTDRLSMTLLGAHPADAPRLVVLSDLIELAGRELLQFRITGTAANPRVSAEPLHRITTPIRRLLRGSE